MNTAYGIPVPVGLALIAAVLYAIWWILQRKLQRIRAMPTIFDTLPAGGHAVPVLATFASSGGRPGYRSYAHNSLFPSLTLFEDRLECTVLMKREILLSTIVEADMQDKVMTRNLILHLQGNDATVTANLWSHRNLSRMLDYLQRRGVSLSTRAGIPGNPRQLNESTEVTSCS